MPVKKLISTIFDVNTINDTLKALEIDTAKMPLGKMSKKNIMKAMSILKDLEGVSCYFIDCVVTFYESPF